MNEIVGRLPSAHDVGIDPDALLTAYCHLSNGDWFEFSEYIDIDPPAFIECSKMAGMTLARLDEETELLSGSIITGALVGPLRNLILETNRRQYVSFKFRENGFYFEIDDVVPKGSTSIDVGSR